MASSLLLISKASPSPEAFGSAELSLVSISRAPQILPLDANLFQACLQYQKLVWLSYQAFPYVRKAVILLACTSRAVQTAHVRHVTCAYVHVELLVRPDQEVADEVSLLGTLLQAGSLLPDPDEADEAMLAWLNDLLPDA